MRNNPVKNALEGGGRAIGAMVFECFDDKFRAM